MGRLIMRNMVTLHGYFEGSKAWDLGWHDVGWGDELERLSIEQTSAPDMLLFGRVTYEGMAAYWPSAKGEIADIMNTIPQGGLLPDACASRLEQHAAPTRSCRGGATPPEAAGRQGSAHLRQRKSHCLTGTPGPHRRVPPRPQPDRTRRGHAPVQEGVKMKLLEARALKTGCVLLRYEAAATRGDRE
jgi:hypothetical protein